MGDNNGYDYDNNKDMNWVRYKGNYNQSDKTIIDNV